MNRKQFWIQISADTKTQGVVRFKAILFRNKHAIWQLNCDIRPDQIKGDSVSYLKNSCKMWYGNWQPSLKQHLPKTTNVASLPIVVEQNAQRGIVQVVGTDFDPSQLAKELFVHYKK